MKTGHVNKPTVKAVASHFQSAVNIRFLKCKVTTMFTITVMCSMVYSLCYTLVYNVYI